MTATVTVLPTTHTGGRTPTPIELLDAKDQAADAADRDLDLGTDARSYQQGVADALAWALGTGPQPNGPAWCEPCNGTGDGPRGRECGACAGRGLEP